MIDVLAHWAHIIVFALAIAYISAECWWAERKNR